MVYPAPFLRLVVIGTLYGNEIFTYSMAFENVIPSERPPTEVPQGVIDAISAFHTSAGAGASQEAELTTIKLNLIGEDGRYVSDGDTVQHDFIPPVPGLGVATQPPQIALAVTLMTNARRGRASRGRFYLPRLISGVAGDGRLSVNGATDVVNDATALLDNLHDALPGWRVAVTSDIGAGEIRQVSHVEVGRVMDTIRSRRNQLDEARLVGPPLQL